ncbi:MAG: TIGR02646 family protein [Magnetococcales bacterium]|nr:TIGR02646 family protein [Magnetococcales bacterium]
MRCYCESRITSGNSHIEHMESRSRTPGRTYDGANLALSCNGGRGDHCGHYKDDRHRNPHHPWNAHLFSAPHDPATAGLFQYLADGSVRATSMDPEKANHMIGHLGLDCARLQERRKRHARGLANALGKQPDSGLVDWLRREYLSPDEHGRLQEFLSLSKAILTP